MKNAPFETDLTDAQWEYHKPMLTKPKKAPAPSDRTRRGGCCPRIFPCGRRVTYSPRAEPERNLDGPELCLAHVCASVRRPRLPAERSILDSQTVKSDEAWRHSRMRAKSQRMQAPVAGGHAGRGARGGGEGLIYHANVKPRIVSAKPIRVFELLRRRRPVVRVHRKEVASGKARKIFSRSAFDVTFY